MLLEESKAKEKFCALIGGNCKGTGCMQWRTWFDTCTCPGYDGARRTNLEELGFRAIATRTTQFGHIYEMAKATDIGYCGLAGKPVPSEHKEPTGEQN